MRARLGPPAFPSLPANARSQPVPNLSGRATSTERPPVNSALYPRARSIREKPWPRKSQAHPPPAPRWGLSRPMSGVHMPRRRREGRQRRINAIRAASAEPSPTPPPPVSSAAVPSAAAVGGAELRGSGRRAAQLLSRRLPRGSRRRGLGPAPLLICAPSPRRSARGLRCPRPAGSC